MGFFIDVHSDQIRTAGKKVFAEGQGISADAGLLNGEIGAGDGIGTDPIGAIMRSFHGRVIPPSIDYFKEVGQATEDFGIALSEVADGYDELQRGNIKAIATITDSLIDLGFC